MVDPASVTLGSLRLFFPIFQAGNLLYDHWKLTRTFGTDLENEKSELEMQYAIFQRTSKLSVCDLQTDIDPNNERHEGTQIVLRYLNTTLERFKACDELMKKYYQSKGTFSVVLCNVLSLKNKNLVIAIISQTVFRYNEELYIGPILTPSCLRVARLSLAINQSLLNSPLVICKE